MRSRIRLSEVTKMNKPWTGEFPNDKPEPRCCDRFMDYVSMTDDDGKHVWMYSCPECGRDDWSTCGDATIEGEEDCARDRDYDGGE
jgi:hypothetical protein